MRKYFIIISLDNQLIIYTHSLSIQISDFQVYSIYQTCLFLILNCRQITSINNYFLQTFQNSSSQSITHQISTPTKLRGQTNINTIKPFQSQIFTMFRQQKYSQIIQTNSLFETNLNMGIVKNRQKQNYQPSITNFNHTRSQQIKFTHGLQQSKVIHGQNSCQALTNPIFKKLNKIFHNPSRNSNAQRGQTKLNSETNQNKQNIQANQAKQKIQIDQSKEYSETDQARQSNAQLTVNQKCIQNQCNNLCSLQTQAQSICLLKENGINLKGNQINMMEIISNDIDVRDRISLQAIIKQKGQQNREQASMQQFDFKHLSNQQLNLQQETSKELNREQIYDKQVSSKQEADKYEFTYSEKQVKANQAVNKAVDYKSSIHYEQYCNSRYNQQHVNSKNNQQLGQNQQQQQIKQHQEYQSQQFLISSHHQSKTIILSQYQLQQPCLQQLLSQHKLQLQFLRLQNHRLKQHQRVLQQDQHQVQQHQHELQQHQHQLQQKVLVLQDKVLQLEDKLSYYETMEEFYLHQINQYKSNQKELEWKLSIMMQQVLYHSKDINQNLYVQSSASLFSPNRQYLKIHPLNNQHVQQASIKENNSLKKQLSRYLDINLDIEQHQNDENDNCIGIMSKILSSNNNKKANVKNEKSIVPKLPKRGGSLMKNNHRRNSTLINLNRNQQSNKENNINIINSHTINLNVESQQEKFMAISPFSYFLDQNCSQKLGKKNYEQKPENESYSQKSGNQNSFRLSQVELVESSQMSAIIQSQYQLLNEKAKHQEQSSQNALIPVYKINNHIDNQYSLLHSIGKVLIFQ